MNLHSLMESIQYKNAIKSVVISCTLFCSLLFLYGRGFLVCPARHYFHIYCPLCGMTRAIMSLLHGDLRQAFIFHPLFPIPPVLYLLYICYCFKWISIKAINIAASISAVLFLVVYIVRYWI